MKMLNHKEEKKFAKLKKMCRELKIPAVPEIFIGLQVHDKDGILIFDDVQRGHSWTRNFWNMIFGAAASSVGGGVATWGAGYMSGKNVAGSIYSATSQGVAGMALPYNYGFPDLSAGGTCGIRVGTGDTAFSVAQTALVTPVAHGNSASQLYYQAMVIPIPTYSTTTWTATHTRIFNNNSGGSITIKEVGLYWVGYIYSSSTGNSPFMLERTVLAPTVAVPNGAQLTVSYQISMDFATIDT
jgi:hypothetical protein